MDDSSKAESGCSTTPYALSPKVGASKKLSSHVLARETSSSKVKPRSNNLLKSTTGSLQIHTLAESNSSHAILSAAAPDITKTIGQKGKALETFGQKGSSSGMLSELATELSTRKGLVDKKKNNSTANLFKRTKPTVMIVINQEERECSVSNSLSTSSILQSSNLQPSTNHISTVLQQTLQSHNESKKK